MDVEAEEQISADGASEVQTQSRKKTKVGNAMQMVGSALLGRLMLGCTVVDGGSQEDCGGGR